MYRSWIIDAIYLYVTDQAGAGNTFTKQRYYVYFRLIDVCTSTYRVVTNHGVGSFNGLGTWSLPEHPEGDQETKDFILRKANRLLATGYRAVTFRLKGSKLAVKDPESTARREWVVAPFSLALGGPGPSTAPLDAETAMPEPTLPPLVKTVWLRTFQLKLGIMHFHTVSGDGWLIPFRDDFVGSRVTSQILVPRPPALEKGLALARCEITPAAESGFEVAIQELLEYHPNVFEPERCRVSQFLTP